MRSQTELLDEFAQGDESPVPVVSYLRPPTDSTIIGIKNASFTWTNKASNQTPASVSTTPSIGSSGRHFVLTIDGELLFKRGRTNLIVGPTGSGKTSLLMALLGEMHARFDGPESFVSLPRDGGVAYAAQESWVLSDTIKASSRNGGFGSETHVLLEQHFIWSTLRRSALCER